MLVPLLVPTVCTASTLNFAGARIEWPSEGWQMGEDVKIGYGEDLSPTDMGWLPTLQYVL